MELMLTVGYYIIFVILYITGANVLFNNPKGIRNIVYFLLCLSVAIWAHGLGLSNSVMDVQKVIFWRRYAAIGWGSTFTLFLHFVLLINRKNSLLSGKKVYLLYLPVLINILLFSLYSPTAISEYELVRMKYYWINMKYISKIDLYYRVYYLSSIFLTIYFLVDLYKNNKIIKHKKRILFNIGFILFMLLCDVLLEYYFISKFNTRIPPLEPLFIFAGLVSFRTLIYRNEKVIFDSVETVDESSTILSSDMRINFYNKVGLVFYLSAFLMFFSLFNEGLEISSLIISSSLFIVLASFVRNIPRLISKEKIQDLILVILMSGSIIQIFFRGVPEKYILDYLWVIPIIYLTITSIFDYWWLSSIIFITGVLFELLMFSRYPVVNISVNYMGYMGRITFYLTSYILNLYVRKVFINRKKKLEKANQQLSLSEKIINQTSDGVCVIGLDKKIQRLNSAFLELTDYSEHDLIGNDLRLLNSEKNIEGFYNKLWDELLNKGTFTGEIWYKTKKEKSKPAWISLNIIKNDEGEAINYIGILSDISELKEKEDQVKKLAYFDSLTGLPNRFYCKEFIKKSIERVKSYNNIVSIIFIDLDGFKLVNDTYGHSFGDLILIETGQRLEKVIKASDLAVRLGGDEFVVVLENISHEIDSTIIAERIIRKLSEPYKIDEKDIHLGASLGIVVLPNDSLEVEEALMKADSAMYTAKELGKNRYCYFSKDIQEKNYEKLELENEIKKALKNNSFMLLIQPKILVSKKSKKIFGGEALIRMKDSEGKIIPPNKFIKVAEDRNLIIPIGRWVINEACRLINELRSSGIETTIAINVSVKQFEDENLVNDLKQAIKRYDVKTEQLEIEITESIFKKNIDFISGVLKELRDFGFKIALDDFGTGYSSLSRITKLPIDCLKIDKSFTDKLESVSERKLVTTIIDLSENFDLETVIEGVETKEQLDILLEEKEELIIQGYLFSKPLEINKFIEYVDSFENFPL